MFNVVKGRGMLGFSPDAPEPSLGSCTAAGSCIILFFYTSTISFFDMLTFVMKRPVGHSLSAMLLL